MTTEEQPNTAQETEEHSPIEEQNNAETDLKRQEMVKVVDELSSGFEGVFCPTLEMIATHLQEIKQSQGILQQLVKEQNDDWKNMPYIKDIEQTFSRLPVYIQKTRDTQKEMQLVLERIEKLKKRSEKLTQV